MVFILSTVQVIKYNLPFRDPFKEENELNSFLTLMKLKKSVSRLRFTPITEGYIDPDTVAFSTQVNGYESVIKLSLDHITSPDFTPSDTPR